jgi:hypothetical protein
VEGDGNGAVDQDPLQGFDVSGTVIILPYSALAYSDCSINIFTVVINSVSL